MPSRERHACQRKPVPVCLIVSLVLLMGLLMFVVVYLTLDWQDIIGEVINILHIF